jgi:serine/threonine protein kinase
LIAFYTLGDEINMLFPFVDGSLHELLYHDKLPENLSSTISFPEDWISRGVEGIAQGLCTIHNPPKPLPDGRRIIGYHFDLKPKNILITWDGVFKITDFGQSLIQVVHIGEKQYGGDEYRGGDPEYAPPEEMPSRDQVERSSYLCLPVESAQIQSPNNPMHPPLAQLPTHRDLSKYDIWSLGCIIIQIYTYICLGASEAVKHFDTERRGIEKHLPYHKNGQLKAHVKQQMDNILMSPTSLKSIATQDYMNAIRDLTMTMLDVDPEKRPKSTEVAKQLKDHLNNYKDSESDETGLLAAANRMSLSTAHKDYQEIAINEKGRSFVTLDKVWLVEGHNSRGMLPCRFKLFHNQENLLLMRCFLKDNKVEHDFDIFPFMSTFINPEALLDGKHHGPCRLVTDRNGSLERKFVFEDGLLEFQAAVVQHVVVPISTEDLSESKRTTLYNLDLPIKVSRQPHKIFRTPQRAIAVQIWNRRPFRHLQCEGEQAQYPVTFGSVSPSNRRLMMFFSEPPSVLQLPLEPRLGKVEVEYKQDETVIKFQGRGSAGSRFYSNVLSLDNQNGLLLPIDLKCYPLVDAFNSSHQNTSEIRLLVKNPSGELDYTESIH